MHPRIQIEEQKTASPPTRPSFPLIHPYSIPTTSTKP
jgi:hypothetical protein